MRSTGVGATVGGAHGGDDPRDAVGEVGDDPVEGDVLCVQTNTTRTASCTAVGRSASNAPGASAR